MATHITIYAGPDGFDSRLFFPSVLSQPALGVSVNLADYSTGNMVFAFNGTNYDQRFFGHDFEYNTGKDFHGIVTSGEVSKEGPDGIYDVIATMEITSGSQNPYGGVPINSAAWLTPDNIVNIMSDGGGAELSFYGGAGADKLFGSNFGDFFEGAAGADKLTGYGGNDLFVFFEIGKSNADHIVDFSHGEDKIVLVTGTQSSPFQGVTAENFVTTFHDITSHAEDRNDRLLYNHNSGALSYDDDGKGGDAAVVFAHLDNHARIDFSDFQIF